MANIPIVDTSQIQAGEAPIPALATVDIWPSLDPTRPFSLQSTGVNNFVAVTNQIGLQNQIGSEFLLGLLSRIGFDASVGGKVHAEPASAQAALTQALSAATLFDIWCGLDTHITLNPTSIILAAGEVFKGPEPICAPCPSDESLKKDIEPLQNALDKVLQLQGVSFNWKEDVLKERAIENPNGDIGLIAQEVEKIVPEVVRDIKVVPDYKDKPDETLTVKSVKYENLVALLIEGMKEQQEQINTLKQTVDELSTKLADCCS